ncbi:hypothetical protein AC244_09950 [Ensifer adhaerens]|uniref:SCP2 domain-containing protein n=1 Tax=Ensifer adhaerens TaxID=106592 RepID=A0A0L8C027_ENSAD|nr:SCP2 sterol-binding domain-containing protein [Ensifer adhaerens]KOF20193.1 hypothetical protein AC244_09950 [Ensifer adhaerens]
MTLPFAMTAPFRIAPLSVIEHATRLVFAQVVQQHPDLFDRLGEHADKRYAFVPTDLPVGFLVEPSARRISVHRKPHLPVAQACMGGKLVLLLALLEGQIDGDAVFFSRSLTITGDMEAMLALRNALDDCNIDLPADIARMSGPFAPLVRRAAAEIRTRALSREAATWN